MRNLEKKREGMRSLRQRRRFSVGTNPDKDRNKRAAYLRQLCFEYVRNSQPQVFQQLRIEMQMAFPWMGGTVVTAAEARNILSEHLIFGNEMQVRAKKFLADLADAKDRLRACRKGCYGKGRVYGDICDCIAMFSDDVIREATQ